MACGTPVIALRRGAALDLVVDGETGFLCDTPEQMIDVVRAASRSFTAGCAGSTSAQRSHPPRWSRTTSFSTRHSSRAPKLEAQDGYTRRRRASGFPDAEYIITATADPAGPSLPPGR